jgi:uncharacterized membrane protein YgdD (TMEM256/DUF423 family)
MERRFFAAAAISGLLAVLLGAFGAHTLRNRIGSDALVIFETGVRYQMYHALALFAAARAAARWPGGAARAAGTLFVVGSVLFSGSLYALALSGIGVLGAITPFGGVSWAAGWICLILASRARGESR